MRNTKALARKVARGTATPQELKSFKAAVSILGYQGARGLGIINRVTGDVVARSWTALAADLLEGLGNEEPATQAHPLADLGSLNLIRTTEADEDAAAADLDIELDRLGPDTVRAIGDELRSWGIGQESPATLHITYLYTTRTPVVPLSVDSGVSAEITTEETAYAEGPCESQASLECDSTNPNPGFFRILPESLLPNTTRESVIQCVPCYEASAEAYVRKLHSTVLL